MFPNLTGIAHADTAGQQDIYLSLLQQTTLGIGSIFIPDMNTTTVPLTLSSQVDSIIPISTLLGQHGEIPPSFQLQAPPKRGRPRGLKTRKGVGKQASVGLEGSQKKLVSSKTKKGLLFHFDGSYIELAEFLGTGKNSKKKRKRRWWFQSEVDC